MATITLTPKNFNKQMSSLHEAVLQSGKLTIKIQEEKDISLRAYLAPESSSHHEVIGPFSPEEFKKISQTW